jgi:hypothetical protein
MKKSFAIIMLALLAATTITAGVYRAQLNSARTERDFLRSEKLALSDSVRVLVQENDALTIAIRTAFPGDAYIDTALTGVPVLPPGIKPADIEDYSVAVFLPPSEEITGESRGVPIDGGFQHRLEIGLKYYDVDATLFVRDNLLQYAVKMSPVPQRVRLYSRRTDFRVEHIIEVPGFLLDFQAYERTPPSAAPTKSRLHWRTEAIVYARPTELFTGLQAGPVWNVWRLDIGGGLGLYSDSQKNQEIGLWLRAGITL